jgi:diguanylate cyclase (GGDEF)-like protein
MYRTRKRRGGLASQSIIIEERDQAQSMNISTLSPNGAGIHGTAELELQLSQVAKVASALARDISADEMRAHALRATVAGTHAKRGVILLYDRSANVYWATAPAIGWLDSDALSLSLAGGDCSSIDDVFAGSVEAFTYSASDGMSAPQFFARAHARNGLIAPVRAGKDIAGVLCLMDKDDSFGDFGDADRAFVRTLLMQLSAALRSARLRDFGAKRGAAKDAKQFSRGDFDEVVSMEIDRAERLGHALGCAVLEVANVAQTLKQYGPAAIDAAVKIVGEAIAQNMRQTDILIRYDESTVALLMPGTNAAGSQVVATRLSQRLGTIDVPRASKLEVRCGVSAYPDEASTGNDLVARAVSRARGNGRP